MNHKKGADLAIPTQSGLCQPEDYRAYLRMVLDLANAPCDRLGLRLA